MTRPWRSLPILACVLFTTCTGLFCLACRDTINVLPSPVPTPTPTPTVTPIPLNVIEFRVNGNPTLAKVRFSDPVDGLTIVTTVLPYSISIQTAQTTMFLSLEATPTAYPFAVNVPVLQVQIFANGALFREANSADFSLNTISVSGTWRK
jgi:hypothetical protein